VTPANRRYVAVETLISVVINTAVSISFAWLVFGGAASVASRAVILDAVPQSFMITLMSVIVPGLLTSRRIAAGRITSLAATAAPWPLAVRALAAAVVAALAGLALHAVVLTWWFPNMIGFESLLAIKAAYGAVLAAIAMPAKG
jgi:hypothetical protein